MPKTSTKPKYRVHYHSNNSGGFWWLSDSHWKALELAGWKVNWLHDRWLGTLARSATIEVLSYKQAVKEFFKITGSDPDAKGCSCCGAPHYFEASSLPIGRQIAYWEVGGKWINLNKGK